MSLRCRGHRTRLPGNVLSGAAPGSHRVSAAGAAAVSAVVAAPWRHRLARLRRGRQGSCPVVSLPFRSAVATLLAIRPTSKDRSCNE